MKWAYLFSETGAPRQTTLCSLFWRCAVGTPGLCIIAIAFVLAIVALGTVIPTALMSLVAGEELSLLVFLPIYLLLMANLLHEDAREMMFENAAQSRIAGVLTNLEEVAVVAGSAAMAVKSRFCPIVRIK